MSNVAKYLDKMLHSFIESELTQRDRCDQVKFSIFFQKRPYINYSCLKTLIGNFIILELQ